MAMGHQILPKIIPVNFAPLLQKRSLIYNSRWGTGFQHIQQQVGQVKWTKVVGCQIELQASAENVHTDGTPTLLDVCNCPTVLHTQIQCGHQELESMQCYALQLVTSLVCMPIAMERRYVIVSWLQCD